MIRQLQVLILAITAVAIASCASGPGFSPQQLEARRHIDEAERLIDLRVWERAMANLDAAVMLDSTNAQAFYLRGVARQGGGHPLGDAIADFDTALQLEPNGPRYLARGMAHRLAGNLDEALADCDEAYYYGLAEGGDPALMRALAEDHRVTARDPLFEPLRRAAQQCLQRVQEDMRRR